MFFKVTLASLMLLGLLSCTPKFGEAPPPQQNLEFKQNPCLDRATVVLGDFFQGEAPDSDLSQAWGCLSSAFLDFKKYVRGRELDRYSSQELATFIEDNYFEKNILGQTRTLSPELQQDFMKLKVILVGGSADFLTRAEIDECVNLTTSLRKMSLEVNSSMKILTMNWNPDLGSEKQASEEFEKANSALQKLAKDFASLVQKNHPTYNLDDFPSILKNLEKFQGSHWSWLPKLDQFMPLVKKIKKAIAGGDESRVVPSEWKIFVLLGSRAYVQFLRFYYFMEDFPDASGSRMGYLARTFEDSFSIFQDLVAEKPTGQVTRKEMGEIFQALAQAWSDFKTSDRFILEVMKIKRLILGGTTEAWTVGDFATAKLKVYKVKDLVERFLPYLEIYSSEWKPENESSNQAQKKFITARNSLIAVMKEAGSLFEESYSWTDLTNLVREMEKLYPRQRGNPLTSTLLNRFACTAHDFKKIYFEESRSDGPCSLLRRRQAVMMPVEKGQWGRFLEFASQGYSAYLNYFYFVDDRKLDSERNLRWFSWFTDETLNLVRRWTEARSKKMFALTDLQTLTTDLRSAKVLPSEVQNKTWNDLLVVLAQRFLISPEDRLSGIRPSGLDAKALDLLRQEFSVWVQTEIYFQNLYETKPQGFRTGELLDEINRSLPGLETQPFLKMGLLEMQLLLNSSVLLSLDSEGRLVIGGPRDPVLSLSTLKTQNFNRMVARTVARSYSNDINRIRNYKGINRCEAEELYSEVKPPFVDLKMLDPNSTSFVGSRFAEANIFLPHSDGNNLGSFEELAELTSNIFSGSIIDSELRKDLEANCSEGRRLGSYFDQVTYSCLRRSYRNSLLTKIPSMPSYVKYLENTEPSQWNEAFLNNMKAAGYVPNDQQVVKVGDASLYPHVLQYTELIFAKFDQNLDGVISKADALKAFPTFQGLLKDLAKKQIAEGTIKESDLEAVFTYIVKYGEIPGCDRSPIFLCLFDSNALRWLRWKASYRNEDAVVYADRNQIAKILGLISDQIRETLKLVRSSPNCSSSSN